MRVLDDRTLGFADFTGNRQYVTAGNIDGDPRVSLFFMDYAARRRLKLLARMRATEVPDVVGRLLVPGCRARVERAMIVEIAALDWNWPQHITPRSWRRRSAERRASTLFPFETALGVLDFRPL